MWCRSRYCLPGGGRWLLLAVLLLAGLAATAQVPVKRWDRAFGGNSVDNLFGGCATPDGGYLLGGSSSSDASGDKTQPPQGSSDFWVVKLDAQGTRQWDRTLGGTDEEELLSLCAMPGGGYMLAGWSASGVSGQKSQPARGGRDFWVVRLDATGTRQWDATLGGAREDVATTVQPTPDGGCLVGGWSYSDVSGDKTEPNRGPATTFDYWVVKLSATGQKQWDRTLGSPANDELRQLAVAPDGSCLLGGWSAAGPGADRTAASRGSTDFWAVKLTAAGALQWDRAYGGTGADVLTSLAPTADGGYALAGYSTSPVSGEKSEPAHPGSGAHDFWLVKIDAQGMRQWDRTLGGTNTDQAHGVQQTPDGGYAVAGVSYSGSDGEKTEPSRGGADYWLVRLSATGQKQWDRTYGGSATDACLLLLATADGSYLLGGYSYSPADADKTQPNRGACDFWVVKVGTEAGSLPGTVRIDGPTGLCAGQGATLTAVAAPLPISYQWNTGATTASISGAPPGTYTVTVTFAGGQQASSSHVVAALAAIPAFRLGADTTLCDGSELLLRGPAGPGLAYQWSDGSTGPTLRVREAGTYTLLVTAACGAQAASRRVAYRTCTLIPNVITPNHDRQNDQFAPTGLPPGPWALVVYNRWGREVFRSDDYRAEWGADAAAGLYFYRLVQPRTGTAYRGWVEVMR